MAIGFLDVCKFAPTLGGLTDWVYATAEPGYQSPTAANAVNGATYRYRAESADFSQWEIGTGAYASGTGTFARTTVLFSSTGSKVNFTTVPKVGITFIAADLGPFQEVLQANRTYIVRSDGSDSNTGLVDSAGGALLTIQAAVNKIAALNINGFNVDIYVKDPAVSYTGNVALKDVTGYSAPGCLIIHGNVTTPANVLIATSGHAFTADSIASAWDVKDLKITTTSGGRGLNAQNGATIRYGNIDFGTIASYQAIADNGGTLIRLSGCTISGGAVCHMAADNFGKHYSIGGTLTLSGTPNFTNSFAECVGQAYLLAYSITFAGTGATGKRFDVSGNSNIITLSGFNYFPGNAAGTIGIGGVYFDVAEPDFPQVTSSAARTTVLTDAGKHIFHPAADTTARVWTIDSNANVPYIIGTRLVFINEIDAGAVTIAITSDTLESALTGQTGSRVLAPGGLAIAIKVTATKWQISGVGIDGGGIPGGGSALQVLRKNAANTALEYATPATGAVTAAFSAHKGGSGQSIGTGFRQLTFGTEVYDDGNLFASSVWTPPAGYVELSARMQFSAATTVGFQLSIYKNGAAFKTITVPITTSNQGCEIVVFDKASGSDTYQVQCNSTSGAPTVSGASTDTWFMGTCKP